MTDHTNENATVCAVAWSSSASGTARTIDCTPNYAEAQQFLRALDPGADSWRFRTIKGGDVDKRPGPLPLQWQTLCDDNRRGRGVFVVVNAGGDKGTDITRCRAVWIDLDGPSLEPALAAVRAAVPGLEPSIIVSSRPGRWHVYWCIDPDDPLPVAEFTPIQKRLIQLTGADKNVHDLPRVMRLPGTLNLKEAPHLVRIVAREQRRYGATLLRQLLEVPAPVLLPPVEAAPVEAASSPAPAPPPAPVPAAAPPPGNLSPYLERMAEVPRLELDKRRAALLADAAHAVASAPEGQRNATLNERGYSLAGMTASDGAPLFTDAEIREALEPAGLRCGLERGEIANALPYAIAAGRLKPYALRDRDPPPKASAGSSTNGQAGEGDAIRQESTRDRPAEDWLQQADDAAEGIGDPDWLIDDWLESGQTAVLFGQSGHGKSFILADILSSIASGLDWCGYPVRQGPVVALVGEGRRGFLRRLKAWKQRHGITERLPVYVSPAPVTLNVAESAQQVAAAIASVTAREGRPPVLVSCDTLRTHLKGDDNESEDTAAFFAGFRAAVAESRAAALTVHHSGHEGTRERGSSNIRAECDLSAQVTMTKDAGVVITVKAVKVRDGEEPPALTLRMHTEELGVDAKGKPVTAGVAVHDAAAAPVEGKSIPKATMAAMQLVGSAWRCTEAEVSGGRPVLREVQLKAYIDGAGGSWTKFNTALRKLTEGGRLSPSPDGWLVVCPVWSAQLLLPLAIGDPLRHEAEQAAARRLAHEQAIVAALEQVASIGADIPAARDGQQPAHKVLAPVLEQHGVTLTTGQFWCALEQLKQAGRVVVVMVERDRKPRQVLRLAEHAGSP